LLRPRRRVRVRHHLSSHHRRCVVHPRSWLETRHCHKRRLSHWHSRRSLCNLVRTRRNACAFVHLMRVLRRTLRLLILRNGPSSILHWNGISISGPLVLEVCILRRRLQSSERGMSISRIGAGRLTVLGLLESWLRIGGRNVACRVHHLRSTLRVIGIVLVLIVIIEC
jgi:hypothetical protein